MDMRVRFQFLTPTVPHAEKADFRAETSGFTSDFQKGFRTGAKQGEGRGPSCSATPAGPDGNELRLSQATDILPLGLVRTL
jgi:hypothetical protein